MPGAESDAVAWQRFLRSNAGGAWSDQEITRLDNCDREATLDAIRGAKGSDYSLLVFVGHGEIRKGDLPWPEAHIFVGGCGSLSESELNSGTPRCTLVFDWSNGTGTELTTPAGGEQGGEQFHALFDQALQSAEGGLVKIYASQLDPFAGNQSSFSALLVQAAERWAMSNHGILSLQQAVSLVSDAIPKSKPRIKAEYEGGRRVHHFPFAVAV
jgi:hypothetical protein